MIKRIASLIALLLCCAQCSAAGPSTPTAMPNAALPSGWVAVYTLAIL